MSLPYYEHGAEEQSLELEHFQNDSHSMLGLAPVTDTELVGSTTSLFQPPSHSSSPSSASQRNHDTKALRGRIGSLLRVPFVAVDNWKQKSRFNGWQWGVLTGLATSVLVLVTNCVFVFVGAMSGSGYNEGIATIFNGSADKVSQTSTLLHIVINVLSTLLLSASNYATQVLSAPTRKECVKAHQQGQWLDIGILSTRNIRSLTLWRKVLWFALGLSSIPLHLLYNASVFQVVTGNDYSIDFIGRVSPEWDLLNKTPNLSNLSVSEIKTAYDQKYVSAHGDVVLWVEKVSIEYEFATFHDQDEQNATLPAINIPLDAPIQPSEARLWAQTINGDGWVAAAVLNEHWRMTAEDFPILMLRIGGAFARPALNSEVQMSAVFLLIVVVCNAVKVGCLGFLLWKGANDTSPPLVTLGDAVAAFLEAPDESTSGYCTYSKAEYFWKTGRLERTLAREQDGRAAKWDKRCDGIWEERTNNYGSAISKWKRIILTFLGFGGPLSLLLLFAVGGIPLTPWATASPLRFTTGSQKFDGNTTARLAFIANSPQLLLSVVFLYFNNMFTSMALAHEWDQFGARRKGLRVTKPRGNQRETYFLQLPLKIGVPLNALSGLLHWLASQTLFVVRMDRRNRDGVLEPDSSLAACGFSSSALLALLLVLITLSAITSVLGFQTFITHIPFAGSCSWVISAACHPNLDEAEPALGRIKWGSISDLDDRDSTIGHCSFSCRQATNPRVGKIYI